jgi:hypothetical protein
MNLADAVGLDCMICHQPFRVSSKCMITDEADRALLFMADWIPSYSSDGSCGDRST